MTMDILINGKVYDTESLTCEDLRVHYLTGHNEVISGTGRSRTMKYHTGFQTNLGDIEASMWIDLMRGLIARLGETELQNQLQQWVKGHCLWLHKPADIEAEALQLHAMRVFDQPQWGAYVTFNRQYRPEILNGVHLIWAKRSCCGKSKQITNEQFQSLRELQGGMVYCQDCAKWTPLVLIKSSNN